MKSTQIHLRRVAALIGVIVLAQLNAIALDVDEFKVKRETIYEFTRKPEITREGDNTTISFESKAFCDVTIAIEDGRGKIVRHLASGVLGPNAPKPFQPNSKKQEVVWDGKNDQDQYIDDKDGLTVRVSLGLKPQFEKSLYWSPYKRISQAAPLMAAVDEGVIVCEGSGVDMIRMYDHEGNYLRTVYPFPADKMKDVKGLDWRDMPQGVHVAWKQSLYQQTLLTSGNNADWWDLGGMGGRAASSIAVCDKDLILASYKLNRLGTDGSTNGRDLLGGSSSVEVKGLSTMHGKKDMKIGPSSAAISPDRKWIYLAGFGYRLPYNFDTMHGVGRIALDGQADMTVFAGKLELQGGFAGGAGSGKGEFTNATSVDCDAQGRVYAGDFMNDRVQIFDPDAKYLKEIKVFKPAIVRVNRKNGEIWVFSWSVPSRAWASANPAIEVTPTLFRFKSFDDPKQISRQELPIGGSKKVVSNGKYGTYVGMSSPLWFTAEVDFNANPVTLWMGRECRNDAESGVAPGNGGQRTPWETAGIRLLHEKDGNWEFVRDFGEETVKQVHRAKPPYNAIQRLEVNPVNGRLYLGEADSGPTGKSSNDLLEIIPESGKIKEIPMPFSAMEYAFDLDGNIYIRNTDLIVRYDSKSYREIPFDYGEQRFKVGEIGSGGKRAADIVAGLALPAKSPVCFHQGGISVNAKGQIMASCAYRFVGLSGTDDVGHYKINPPASGESYAYQPSVYPGRISGSTTPCLHIWDKHGNLIYEDAAPGVGQLNGVGLDRDCNVYYMQASSRVLDGKPYPDRTSETVVKVKPGASKTIVDTKVAPVPVSATELPKRPPDVRMDGGDNSWIEGAEWLYGGVGFAGFSPGHAPACACWFSRFTLDYFARSFAPEPTIYSVAIIDSAGNLITRVGRYGNVDDGKPMVPSNGQPTTASLGGDEVGLFYACYVGTHTDRRLFISDVGNGRIVSVKLNYYKEERIALKDIVDKRPITKK